MKICIISTTVIPCPPSGYSGLEMVAYHQAKGLKELGHEVTLIAPIGSVPPEGVALHGTTLYESERQAYSGYWQKLKDFDVIIDNSWEKWSYILKLEGNLKAPILGVLHAPVHTMYASAPPVAFPCLVCISLDQSRHAGETWGVNTRVAYNGIDLNFYKKNSDLKYPRLLFLARMSKIKGPHLAIEACRQAHCQLDLVGDDRLTAEPEYAHRIRAMASGVNGIKYEGPVDREKTLWYYSTRQALLHMNEHYREPFGLAPVEAQACGLPVIAWDNGAMRETVKHGVTGALVTNLDEVISLIKNKVWESINPAVCREWASQFSVENMARRYQDLCQEALDTGGW